MQVPEQLLAVAIPRSLIRLTDSEGARTLQALYGEVSDPGAVIAWESGKATEPPFVRDPGYAALQVVVRRSRTRVAEDLRRLRALGAIRRAERGGWRGWELLGGRQSQERDDRVPPAGPTPWSKTSHEAHRPEVGRVVRARQGRYIAAVERVGQLEMHLVAPDGTRRKAGLGQNGRHISSGPYKLTEYVLRPPAEMTLLQCLQRFVKEVVNASR